MLSERALLEQWAAEELTLGETAIGFDRRRMHMSLATFFIDALARTDAGSQQVECARIGDPWGELLRSTYSRSRDVETSNRAGE